MILKLADDNKFCLHLSEEKSKLVLTVSASFNGNVYEIYDGDYIVNPKVTSQELETKDKVLEDNVTINAIYYNETENQGGGYTAQIGEI